MKKDINEQVDELKKNLEKGFEKSKEAIKGVIENYSKQVDTALTSNKELVDMMKHQMNTEEIDSSVLDSIKKTFGGAIVLSEEIIDSIIDSHSKRTQLNIEFTKKYIETIRELALSKEHDYEKLIALIQENFEASVKLSSENMKKVIDSYNKHSNLALNFNKKFVDGINNQVKVMSKVQSKNMDIYRNWLNEWWKEEK